jgi:hypothetical protein
MIRELIAALVFAATIVAGSAVAAKAPESLTAVEQLQLQDNLNRGQLLYRYDQAAWHTTDTMVAHVPETQRHLVRGWVVTEGPRADKVTYFGMDGDRPFVVYSAGWDGSKISNEEIPAPGRRPPLAAEEQRLAAALIAAWPAAQKLGRCSDRNFNTVVLPGKSPADPISVYFMTPQTKTNQYPMGGHYRVDINNGTVVHQRKFANSCINLDTSPHDGVKPAGLGITHLLDPVPTEIHVFSVFAALIPVYVAAKDRLFVVEVSNGQARVRDLGPTGATQRMP